jgi:hypothetical protein
MVSRTLNVFQRHIPETLELKNGDHLKEIARSGADGWPSGPAAFEMSQERLAFPSQRCGSVACDCSGKLKIPVEHEGISAETSVPYRRAAVGSGRDHSAFRESFFDHLPGSAEPLLYML